MILINSDLSADPDEETSDNRRREARWQRHRVSVRPRMEDPGDRTGRQHCRRRRIQNRIADGFSEQRHSGSTEEGRSDSSRS